MPNVDYKKKYPKVYEAFEDKMFPGALDDFIKEYESLNEEERMIMTLKAMESDAESSGVLETLEAVFGALGRGLDAIKEGTPSDGTPTPPKKGGLPQA